MKVYSVLSVLNVMRFPMSAFPFVISSAISANVSKKRLQEFLLSEELDQFHGYHYYYYFIISINLVIDCFFLK